MTIEKGAEWGVPITRPTDAREASTDAEIVDLWLRDAAQPIVLTGGDLYRSLGAPPARDQAMRLPIDLLTVSTDTHTVMAAAHVVARRRWWRGRIVAAMNTDHLGTWNVAPRAHPNDGRVDIVEVDTLTLRQRWQARSRLPTGSHVPHPAIRVSALASARFEFAQPLRVWIDDRPYAPTSRLTVTVEPDAATVIV